QEAQLKELGAEAQTRSTRKVKTKLILLTVGRKLMSNPNTHATLAALIWASIQFRWGVKLPEIIDKLILILSSGGLGMAMFSIACLFMASQPSILACGAQMAVVAIVRKFIAEPTLMAASCLAISLIGELFRVAIVHAALPQGIVPFVFAKQYNVHLALLGTG
ncbi:Mem_trans domain-containing protein, partial [Cephalotus follicularis]